MFYEDSENIYDDLFFLKQQLSSVGRSSSSNDIMSTKEIRYFNNLFKIESKKMGYKMPEIFKYCKTSGEIFKFLQQQGRYVDRDSYITNIFNPILELYDGDDYLRDEKSSVNLKEKMISDNGSYAIVYKFKDPIIDSFLAYKTLRKKVTEKEIYRFNYEYEIMSSLNSNNVVKVYRRTEEGYIMELCDYTLEKYIELKNPLLTPIMRKRLLIQIFRVFTYLHQQDILHRDLSYRNVLIKDFDDNPIIKISDFGLVKTLESKVTSSATEIKGSLADPWLSHNGFKNYYTKNEIYSLGYIINKIVTGKDTIRLDEIKNEPYKNFITKCIDHEIENRFSSVVEVARECINNFDNFFAD